MARGDDEAAAAAGEEGADGELAELPSLEEMAATGADFKLLLEAIRLYFVAAPVSGWPVGAAGEVGAPGPAVGWACGTSCRGLS